MENAIGSSEVLKKYLSEEWAELTPSEKSVCLTYVRHHLKDLVIAKSLLGRINEIHEEHPDFHIGCVPGPDGWPPESA